MVFPNLLPYDGPGKTSTCRSRRGFGTRKDKARKDKALGSPTWLHPFILTGVDGQAGSLPEYQLLAGTPQRCTTAKSFTQTAHTEGLSLPLEQEPDLLSAPEPAGDNGPNLTNQGGLGQCPFGAAFFLLDKVPFSS